MTTIVTGRPALDLRALTDAQLAGAFGRGEITMAELERECDRRERAERTRAAQARRYAEWRDYHHAEFVAAEDYCRGNMLSAAGKRAGTDPARLWCGAEDKAYMYASEELREWWLAHPRLTPGEWDRQRRASERAELEAALTETRAGAAVASVAPLSPSVQVSPVALPQPVKTPPAVALHRPTIPPMTPGAIARYANALSNYASHIDQVTARMLANHGRLAGRTQR